MAGVVKQGYSEPLDDGDVGLTAAFAHGLQAVALARALELMEHRGHQAGAGRAEGVAKRDGAAVHVGLGVVVSDVLQPGEDDRRIQNASILQHSLRARPRGREER